MLQYKVLNSKGKTISTDVTLHPGEILVNELSLRQIKKIDFAAMLGIRPGHLTELLQGKRNVSAALAIRLEELLNIDAEYWMRVQVYNDLFIERNKIHKITASGKDAAIRLAVSRYDVAHVYTENDY